jgi:16S rRNA C1402 (ribose-2'-O) methylase RsmI
MSTFYSDGFQDCINYRGYLPPSPQQRNDGGISTVHQQEYLDGYEAAQRVIAKGLRKHYVFVEPYYLV